jgi:molybdopterin-synthase adenylyltransferase
VQTLSLIFLISSLRQPGMNRPKIKLVHNPERLSRNRIRIGTFQYGVGSEIQDTKDHIIWRIMQLMDGSRTIDEISQCLLQDNPSLDEENIVDIVNTLIANGFVEDEAGPFPSNLSPQELERYDRSANFFAWIDTHSRPSRHEIQSNLKQKRVTVLGMGGTGCAVAMSLVASGIGELQCVDYDRVEISNLNRQILFTEKDIGYPKAERAARHLRRLNSNVKITSQSTLVQSSTDVVPLMQGSDLFILCADKPIDIIPNWVNEASSLSRTPWLISAYTGPMLVMGLFIPGKTACYHCIQHTEKKKQASRKNKAIQSLYPLSMLNTINATIAPVANLVGHFSALEAIYFLGGLQPYTVGRILHQNLMVYDHMYFIEAPRWLKCPVCGNKKSTSSYEKISS